MGISGDYPRPITVNGYACRNCDEVADAKKFIDPSKPKSGPESGEKIGDAERAVQFGGALAFRNNGRAGTAAIVTGTTGQVLNRVA